MIATELIAEAHALVALHGGEPARERVDLTVDAFRVRSGSDPERLSGSELTLLCALVIEVVGTLLHRPAADFVVTRWSIGGRGSWRVFCVAGPQISEGEVAELVVALRDVFPTVCREALLTVDHRPTWQVTHA